jgi:hypothetical protein
MKVRRNRIEAMVDAKVASWYNTKGSVHWV